MRLRGLLLASILGGLSVPPVTSAQPAARMPRIGYLEWGSPEFPTTAANREAFLQGLRDLGHVEGRSFTIEYRWAEGKLDRLPDLSADLVRLKVDVIVAGSNPAIIALKQATQTIPIVMTVVGDPVGTGLVASLAKPGGNITGLSNLAEGLTAKWLELLKETVPKLARVAVLAAPATPAHAVFWREIQGAAQTLGVIPQLREVRGPDEIYRAFAALIKERAGGIVVLPHPVTVGNKQQILDLAAKSRLPGMYPWKDFVEAGGLMAYSTSLNDMYRRAATFVDKILKGAKPADLPVAQPMRFELVVNLKTAKALGLTMPQSILIRADEVIR